MSAFVPQLKKSPKGATLGILLNKTPVKGDIGIEIEVEGYQLPKDNTHLKPYWSYHHDGSLRGRDNAEYVLSRPISFDKVVEAVDNLWDKFKECKSKLDDSNRTSVHVHLNVQEFHLNRLTSFAALYFCVEEILSEWCGDHRVGNLFCLRAKDARAIVSRLRRFITAECQSELSEGLHYSAFNTRALYKFGSIEIRLMRGVSDKKFIVRWCKILQRLYELSAKYPDPRDICSAFSQNGPLSFYELILGDYAFAIRQDIAMTTDEIVDSMYTGIRLAQDLCYCRDWDDYKCVDIKPDPFGRRIKTFDASVLAALAPLEYPPFNPTQWAVLVEDSSSQTSLPVPHPNVSHNYLEALGNACADASDFTDEEYEEWVESVADADEPDPEYDADEPDPEYDADETDPEYDEDVEL